jgi:hypothetical protein
LLDEGKNLGIPHGVLINGKGPYRPYISTLLSETFDHETINVEPGELQYCYLHFCINLNVLCLYQDTCIIQLIAAQVEVKFGYILNWDYWSAGFSILVVSEYITVWTLKLFFFSFFMLAMRTFFDSFVFWSGSGYLSGQARFVSCYSDPCQLLTFISR